MSDTHHKASIDTQLSELLNTREIPSDYLISKTLKKISNQEEAKNYHRVWLLGLVSMMLFWLEIGAFLYFAGYQLITLAVYTILSSSINLVVGLIFLQKRRLMKGWKLQ